MSTNTAKKYRSGQRLISISGGKAPLTIVTDFVVELGGDPESLTSDSSSAMKRWDFVAEKSRVTVELDGIGNSTDVVINIRTPVCSVPLRQVTEILAATLESSRALISCKPMLYDNVIFLGASLSGSAATAESLRYHLRLLLKQKDYFFESINKLE